jgi:transposase
MAKQGRRPTELENPKIQNLITALRAGNYFEHACAYAGIASSTAYRWLERGRREQSSQADGNKPNAIEQHYLELCETIEKARADAIVGNVAIIQNAAKAGTWQAAAWWLERTMPNQFGRQLKAEVTTVDNTTDADADIARIITYLDEVDKGGSLEMDSGTGED